MWPRASALTVRPPGLQLASCGSTCPSSSPPHPTPPGLSGSAPPTHRGLPQTQREGWGSAEGHRPSAGRIARAMALRFPVPADSCWASPRRAVSLVRLSQNRQPPVPVANILDLLLRPLLLLVLLVLQVVLLQVDLPGQERGLLILLQLVLCVGRTREWLRPPPRPSQGPVPEARPSPRGLLGAQCPVWSASFPSF